MDKEGAERYYIRTLEDLCRHLDSNGPLRDALLWELASDSEAVKKIADIRELENESLLAYYRWPTTGNTSRAQAWTSAA